VVDDITTIEVEIHAFREDATAERVNKSETQLVIV
jgi:hypothetical protein